METEITTDATLYVLDTRSGLVHVITLQVPDELEDEEAFRDSVLSFYDLDHSDTNWMVAYGENEIIEHDFTEDSKDKAVE